MPRIAAVDPAVATGAAKQLLDIVQSQLGITPNLMRTLANAPAALKGFLDLNTALAGGVLDSKFREQIALAVAQANACDYCLSAHTTLGAMVGLTPNEIAASREGRSFEARRDAGLKLAQSIVANRGQVPDASIQKARAAGLNDAETDRDRRQRRAEHPDQLPQPRGADGCGFPARGGRTRRYGLKLQGPEQSRSGPFA